MRKVAFGFFIVSLIMLFLPGKMSALNNPGSSSDPSSVADLDVTLSVPTMFRISGINDLSFGSYSGSGNLSLNDDVCVWTNDESGEYRITAQGDGTAFAFVVKKVGDNTKQIPYTMYWNDTSGTSNNVQLTANVTSGNQTGANTQSTGCSSGAAATGNFQVVFQASDLQGAVSGSYAGVLTLTISAAV